jgi:citrate lyase alpha subunit
MHEEGLIGRLIDVQSLFDKIAAESLKKDPMHKEVAANEYAAADEPGAASHYLDIVILSALEVDVNFNVNVLVGSDGIIAVPLVDTPTRQPTTVCRLSYVRYSVEENTMCSRKM